MKNYNSLFEFIIGLLGVSIHSVIVIFIISYLAYPEMLYAMLETSTSIEKEMLTAFINDVNQIVPILYLGTAIVIFEWIAIFKIFKYENKLTPVWSAYLLLGSLYAYFYFGGLEVFVLLFVSGLLTLIKYYKYHELPFTK